MTQQKIEKRIVLTLRDERTNVVLSEVSMLPTFFDNKRLDVLDKLYEIGNVEARAVMTGSEISPLTNTLFTNSPGM